MKKKSLFVIAVFCLLPFPVVADGSDQIVTEEDHQLIANLELLEHLVMLEDMDVVQNYDVLENGSSDDWLGTDEEAE